MSNHPLMAEARPEQKAAAPRGKAAQKHRRSAREWRIEAPAEEHAQAQLLIRAAEKAAL